MIDVPLSLRVRVSPRGAAGLVFSLLGPILFGFVGVAEARSRGVSGSGCEGCHGSTENSSLSVSPTRVSPGENVTLRFSISDPEASVGGLFISLPDSASVSPGSNLANVSGGISHTRAVSFSGDEAVFQVAWQVPSGAGATRFEVSGLAGNGNGRSSGDEGSFAVFDFVYGCEPQIFYPDYDGDGYGRSLGTRTQCAGSPPEGYSVEPNDCDDNSPEIHPGAIEYCNRRDDDCDGELDENAQPVELYPDADGDGFYTSDERASGDMVMGCLPYVGYADRPGDCDGERDDVNPEAEEVCDLYSDEDCDGRVDERVRPICGVGWCRRESSSCDLEHCTPGRPSEERCNFLDDDCDGDVDEGEGLCPAGEQCLAGECRTEDEAGMILSSSGEGSVSGGDGSDAGSGADSAGGTPRGQEEASESAGCQWTPWRSPLIAPWALLAMAGLLWRRRRLNK